MGNKGDSYRHRDDPRPAGSYGRSERPSHPPEAYSGHERRSDPRNNNEESGFHLVEDQGQHVYRDQGSFSTYPMYPNSDAAADLGEYPTHEIPRTYTVALPLRTAQGYGTGAPAPPTADQMYGGSARVVTNPAYAALPQLQAYSGQQHPADADDGRNSNYGGEYYAVTGSNAHFGGSHSAQLQVQQPAWRGGEDYASDGESVIPQLSSRSTTWRSNDSDEPPNTRPERWNQGNLLAGMDREIRIPTPPSYRVDQDPERAWSDDVDTSREPRARHPAARPAAPQGAGQQQLGPHSSPYSSRTAPYYGRDAALPENQDLAARRGDAQGRSSSSRAQGAPASYSSGAAAASSSSYGPSNYDSDYRPPRRGSESYGSGRRDSHRQEREEPRPEVGRRERDADDAGHRERDTGHRERDASHRARDSGHRERDAGHRARDSVRRERESRSTRESGRRKRDGESRRGYDRRGPDRDRDATRE